VPGIDDRLRRDLDRLAGRGDPAGAFERVSARRRRRGLVRRAQVAGLAVAVLTAIAGGTWALARAFRFREEPAPAAPQLPLTGNGKIAFVSDRDGNQEIYTMNPDGTGARRLTDHPAADVFPAWSPDGKRIAFARATEENSDIYLMRADGSGLENLTDTPSTEEGQPAWSPDGSRIAFVGNGAGAFEIWVMNADGSGARSLTGIPEGVVHPAWSPDGTRIAFNPSFALGRGAIYLVNADGSGQVRIFRDEKDVFDLIRSGAWSPDGTSLVFNRSANGGRSNDVFLIRSDGTGLTGLTTDRESGSPTWSPDGGWIAFTGFRGAGGKVFMMKADGTERRLLADVAADGFGLSWQPVAVGMSPAPTETSPSPIETSPMPVETPPEELFTAFGPLCGVTWVNGDFDGDGKDDLAAVAYPQTSDTCPDEPPENEWKVYVMWDNGAAGAWPLSECERACRAFAVADLDGDGADELFAVVNAGAATEFLRGFELPVGPLGPIRLLVHPPGTPDYPGDQPLQLELGGSVTHQAFITCERGDGVVGRIIATRGELDQEQSLWLIEETVFSADFDEGDDYSLGNGMRGSRAFQVLSTREFTDPFDPSGDDPLPVRGDACFALE
jgi:dipeptidyl aminopeptidase/acylaminoacyl peptidase